MKATHLQRTAWFTILLVSIFIGRASGIEHFAEFAKGCGTTAVVASARVFSDNDKNTWKAYPTGKQVPENEEWSETAYVWAKPGSPVVIEVEGIGEDFADSTYYCFDTFGKVSSLEHEFRTAWEWGFIEYRKFDSGGNETTKSHFFSMKDRKEIPRPQGTDDVREAMTVKIYRTLPDVPFFELLTRETKTK